MAIKTSIENKELFSSRLKELRKEKKLTMKKLGEMASLSEQAISHYENGIRLPRFEILCELAHALDVDPDYLSGESNKKYSSPLTLGKYELDRVLNSISNIDDKVLNEFLGDAIFDFQSIVNFGSFEDIVILSTYIRLFSEYVTYSAIKRGVLPPIKGSVLIKNPDIKKSFIELINSLKKLDAKKDFEILEYNDDLFKNE
ncbi:MAG: helix-turn-helix transcriptional regulator [Clostridium sp.]|nr:helix-turn-helix transcriptional regulator [Clostridium sp.]